MPRRFTHRDDLDAQARGFRDAASEAAEQEGFDLDPGADEESPRTDGLKRLSAEQEWFTTADIAIRHRLQPATIRKYIRDGKLKASGTPYRIHRDDELEWSEAKQSERPTRRKSPSRRKSTFTDLTRKAQ